MSLRTTADQRILMVIGPCPVINRRAYEKFIVGAGTIGGAVRLACFGPNDNQLFDLLEDSYQLKLVKRERCYL